MIKNLAVWMLSGLFTISAAVTVHLIRAEQKGYNPWTYWDKENSTVFKEKHWLVKFIFGLMIWPIRLYQFVKDIPNLYDRYNEN